MPGYQRITRRLLAVILVATCQLRSVQSFTTLGTLRHRARTTPDIGSHSSSGIMRLPVVGCASASSHLLAHRPLVRQQRKNNNDDAYHRTNASSLTLYLSRWCTRCRQQHRRAAAVGTAAALLLLIIATTLTAAPPMSYARDLAAPIVAAGGAMEQSSAWLRSLTETGFYQAFSLVFLSEIGDKTFFIAGLLAMKTSRFISFIGSMCALAAMTLVSVGIGQVFHAVPSGFADGVPLDDICACLAFAFFGIKTLKEALDMDSAGEDGKPSAMDEELAEAQETVDGSRIINTPSAYGNIAAIFGLVFAAEFGDRSFLSTIALSAAQNPVSVAGGAIAAHALATGVAVSGGAVLAKYISERVIGLIGGTLFLVFAVTTALGLF